LVRLFGSNIERKGVRVILVIKCVGR